jgi:hypothetical protein
MSSMSETSSDRRSESETRAASLHANVPLRASAANAQRSVDLLPEKLLPETLACPASPRPVVIHACRIVISSDTISVASAASARPRTGAAGADAAIGSGRLRQHPKGI